MRGPRDGPGRRSPPFAAPLRLRSECLCRLWEPFARLQAPGRCLECAVAKCGTPWGPCRLYAAASGVDGGQMRMHLGSNPSSTAALPSHAAAPSRWSHHATICTTGKAPPPPSSSPSRSRSKRAAGAAASSRRRAAASSSSRTRRKTRPVRRKFVRCASKRRRSCGSPARSPTRTASTEPTTLKTCSSSMSASHPVSDALHCELSWGCRALAAGAASPYPPC